MLSGPKTFVVWRWDTPASGWGSFWERSSIVPWLSPYVFRDVFGTDPEWPWIIGLRRNTSSRDRASKMRFSVLLNSWDNFFVSLSSIFSETCVIKSCCDLGKFVSRPWLLLRCSSWFYLWRAARFRLFLKITIAYGKITNSGEDRINFI